jgi:hypothetical protein
MLKLDVFKSHRTGKLLMNRETINIDSAHYAKCIEVSKRIRWDIDHDVIRDRQFDLAHHFLPPGLSGLSSAGFLYDDEKRLLSQIQGRSYANMFGIAERFINAKVLEITHAHWFGDQTALEALVRFSEEEIKHQELFRRIEKMIGDIMPAGYRFVGRPNDIARNVLQRSTWSVLALTCNFELLTQAHYKTSMELGTNLSPLFRDVFYFHWKEESQHAILDELEWRREDQALTAEQRAAAIDDLISLIGAVDATLRRQAQADAAYFAAINTRPVDLTTRADIESLLLKAYRYQFIGSGFTEPRFMQLMAQMITPEQNACFEAALATILRPH